VYFRSHAYLGPDHQELGYTGAPIKIAKLVKFAIFRPAGATVYADRGENLAWYNISRIHCLTPSLGLIGKVGGYRSPKVQQLVKVRFSFTTGLKPTSFTNPTPVVSLLPPGLPSWTLAWTVSSELLVLCLFFLITCPPNGPVLFCSLATVVCRRHRRLSLSSVTLPEGGRAASRPADGRVGSRAADTVRRASTVTSRQGDTFFSFLCRALD